MNQFFVFLGLFLCFLFNPLRRCIFVGNLVPFFQLCGLVFVISLITMVPKTVPIVLSSVSACKMVEACLIEKIVIEASFKCGFK
jgi:hypothetical protein